MFWHRNWAFVVSPGPEGVERKQAILKMHARSYKRPMMRSWLSLMLTRSPNRISCSRPSRLFVIHTWVGYRLDNIMPTWITLCLVGQTTSSPCFITYCVREKQLLIRRLSVGQMWLFV